MKNFRVLIFITISVFCTHAQTTKRDTLKEVVITSTRIDVPFSKTSKNITIISSMDIQRSTASNMGDLLQNIEGIDIIRRGTNGMQADIKIRGSNFEQTLILIDGFKVENPQTGHHTMNMMIPLENIERIEIIKGSAARVFGQNAFAGAINIVTKKITKENINLNANFGSYNYERGAVTVSKQFKKVGLLAHFSQQTSDGYRNNTDFINNNYFIKSSFKTKKEPIKLIATFADRKFGAQYFYTSPASNFTEYEETQASLVGVSTKYRFSKLIIKPKIYWKRGQDIFLLKRNNPSFSRNHNISNKIGVELNNSYKSSIGITGFGVDVAKVSLVSNNLGNQNRTMLNAFIEHRFVTANEKFDFTPGIAMNYFSDFGSGTFPGLDVGFKANKNTRLYWNIGSSYRVPTYIEMYINIPNFLSGNDSLKPETAVSQEMGLKYNSNLISFNVAAFYRTSNNLIDYVKKTSASPFYEAQNLRTINTQGLELSLTKPFKIKEFQQKIRIGYTFLEDNYGLVSVFKSRYLLNNTIKHHFTANLQTQIFKNITQSVSYRYIERPINKYHVLDAKLNMEYKDFSIYGLVNNILDEYYYEKIFVQMPRSNFEFGFIYKFK